MDKKSGGPEDKKGTRDAAKDFRGQLASRAAQAAVLAEEKQVISRLGKREFQERLNKLAQGVSAEMGNPGSYGCTGCSRCTNCMFCVECDSCYQCTHCTRCELCGNCSHCVDCKSCNNSAYCTQSENCISSAYLVLCRKLSDCTYCFGCVGLSKKDFHILNVPFSRKEYFDTVARLKKELGFSDGK